MWLISNSKDLLDVSKRTIVAKVKSFACHIHTFNLIHVMTRKGLVFSPCSLVLRSALAVEEVLVFFELELIVTLDITLFSSF